MKRDLLFRQMITVVAIVALASMIGVGVNQFRDQPLPWIQDWDATMAGRIQHRAAAEVQVVDISEMTELYRQAPVVVLDARAADFYDLEHIPGARNLPVTEVDRRLTDLLGQLPADTRLVTYCEGPTCPDGLELARKIAAAGYTRVSVFVGGMEEWLAAGMPVEGSNGG